MATVHDCDTLPSGRRTSAVGHSTQLSVPRDCAPTMVAFDTFPRRANSSTGSGAMRLGSRALSSWRVLSAYSGRTRTAVRVVTPAMPRKGPASTMRHLGGAGSGTDTAPSVSVRTLSSGGGGIDGVSGEVSHAAKASSAMTRANQVRNAAGLLRDALLV